MTGNIVLLRDGKPALTDISGRLRTLADQIDAGEWGDVSAVFVLVPREEDWPRVFGFGEVKGTNDPAIVCEMAKMWLLNNRVGRP